MSLPRPVVGVVGGSGLYDIDGLTDVEWRRIDSPFGEPSDDILFGMLDGVPMRFLPRHGRGHAHSPTSIDYRANIDAMKRAGCTEIISLSAVGGLQEDAAPGTFVLVDQFIDRTVARERSFFGAGCAAHVSLADPVCPVLFGALAAALGESGIPHLLGGTYLAMEGPQFSTKAESALYRSWGCRVIGMTNMPEARLAREAEIAYATVAMVTDYDCWHPDHDDVSVDGVIEVLLENAEKARTLLRSVVPRLKTRTTPSPAHSALEHALITRADKRDPELLAKLDAVAGRVLNR